MFKILYQLYLNDCFSKNMISDCLYFFCTEVFFKVSLCFDKKYNKAELLQLNRTQFPSLGIFIIKKVGN